MHFEQVALLSFSLCVLCSQTKLPNQDQRNVIFVSWFHIRSDNGYSTKTKACLQYI